MDRMRSTKFLVNRFRVYGVLTLQIIDIFRTFAESRNQYCD